MSSSPLQLLPMGPTTHHPKTVSKALGPPFLLAMKSIGSKAFVQFAPIRTLIDTASIDTASSEGSQFDLSIKKQNYLFVRCQSFVPYT